MITIVSLMGGRWHTLEGWISSMLNLDYDPSQIKMVWFSNGGKAYIEILKRIAPLFEARGTKVEIVHDESIPPSDNVFMEGGIRTDVHVNVISALYNAAWQYVDTDDVFFIEDDVWAPSHAIKRLIKVVDENELAAFASGVVFDRHEKNNVPIAFVWEMVRMPEMSRGDLSKAWLIKSVSMPWGVRKVNTTGFSCCLIRRSRLPQELQIQRFPFKTENPIEGMAHLRGCDIVFGLEVGNYGKEVYCDFDVRPFHVDSKGNIH